MSLDLFNAAKARVAGAYLQPLLDSVAGFGLAKEQLLTDAGLAGDSLTPIPEAISAQNYLQLLDAAARLTGDPLLGLHIGEKVKLGTYSVYGLILLSCHHIGQVLQQTLRYEGLAHDLGRSQLVLHGEVAHYYWHSHFPNASRHLVESVFAGIRVFGQWLTGQPLPVTTLRLRHPAPALSSVEMAEYQRVLGVVPEFGALDNCAQFDAALLNWPVPNADVSLYPVLQQHAEQLLQQKMLAQQTDDIITRVTQHILLGMAQDQVRLSMIAGQMNLTPRTLQRKLSEAGSSFQSLLDQTRYQQAQHYLLQTDFSLTDIAFLLGFQEQSSFTHAFKEWAGQNPGAYREQFKKNP
jgi:AraC-like DNA-binding protein